MSARHTYYLTQAELDDLLEYSTSLPTGTKAGKLWKRDAEASEVRRGDPRWIIGQYLEAEGDQVPIRWMNAELVDERCLQKGAIVSALVKAGRGGAIRRTCIVDEVRPMRAMSVFALRPVSLTGRWWTNSGRWSKGSRMLIPPWRLAPDPHEELPFAARLEAAIQRSANVHSELAKSIGNPEQVWCRTCGRSQPVQASRALRMGWPKCCGSTMTIDPPPEVPTGE